MAGYANDVVGYVSTVNRYDVSNGSYSYPAHFVPFMLGEHPFRPNVGAVLTNALADLRRELSRT